MNRVKDLIAAVHTSTKANADTHLNSGVLSIEGMSGTAYKKFANRLLSNAVVQNYLEIGVWKGSTAISALYGNQGKINHTVVDNFCQFNGPKDEFISNWKSHLGCEPNLLDMDCFGFDPKEKNIKDIDVYFYDGEHTEEDQFKALVHYYDAMRESFIYMVDDWAWDKVQRGTRRAIGHLNLKTALALDFYGVEDRNGWWNGCGIFVFIK